MIKLIPFPITNHRFYDNQKLSDDVLSLGRTIQPINSDFGNILVSSIHEEKLHLLLKVMMEKHPALLENLTYQIRLTHEINTILNHDEDFILDFFLIYEDIAHWFEKRNEIGMIGRGAAPSSLVNYLLGITKIDPVKHNLIFSRWLDTKSIPQIDLDCLSSSKVELREYLKNTYPEAFQEVQVLIKWKIKSTMKEVLKNNGFKSIEFTQLMMDIIDRYEHMKNSSGLMAERFNSSETEFFEYILSQEESLETFFKVNPSIKTEFFSRLDEVKTIGRHAAGIVLSDTSRLLHKDIYEDKVVIFNILGMTAYEDINSHSKLSNIDLNNLDPEKIKKQMSPLRVGGFLDKTADFYNKHLVHDYEVQTIDDVAKTIALARTNLLFLGKGSFSPIDDARVNSHIVDTNGQLVYQEQLMAIIGDCLDIQLDEARYILKNISNKNDKYYGYKDQYVLRTGENGEEIWEYLELVAPYCFNKAHAYAYAYVDYLSLS